MVGCAIRLAGGETTHNFTAVLRRNLQWFFIEICWLVPFQENGDVFMVNSEPVFPPSTFCAVFAIDHAFKQFEADIIHPISDSAEAGDGFSEVLRLVLYNQRTNAAVLE